MNPLIHPNHYLIKPRLKPRQQRVLHQLRIKLVAANQTLQTSTQCG
ncbi:hypothetical protein ESCAB7627_3862 [Escherichia albertii TW07627]|uniref:Transposase n=1 Tax=Escherichia albertii (strain TW07627) TaxID=502347 RepID=A0ABC9NK43_ESCAT|nr:hypothetical protein ESCAB7627_3862 [Escherichia albertii TW07627]